MKEIPKLKYIKVSAFSLASGSLTINANHTLNLHCGEFVMFAHCDTHTDLRHLHTIKSAEL